MKDIKSQIQEVLQTPERAIEKKTTPIHITVKQWKNKTENHKKTPKQGYNIFKRTIIKLRTESSIKKDVRQKTMK